MTFYFIEICNILNYADVNTLSVIRDTINILLSVLKNDAENAMSWFTNNFMEANQEN